MNLLRMTWRELLHRPVNFVLAVIAVVLAVGTLTALFLRLADHDAQTQRILADHQATVVERGRLLEDDMRKITKGLGFNVLILPADQPLGDVFAEGYASRTMPEEYVRRLAESQVITVDHLLPAIEQRIEWPEQKRTILLIGVRGEVPIVNQKVKKPLIDPVPEGGIVLGHDLARQIDAGVGSEVTLMDRTFTVSEVYDRRGNKDDITAWVQLGTAQAMLGLEGRINSIWALNCNCSTLDMLSEVEAEIARVLPDTQVTMMMDKATARADARNRAAKQAQDELVAAQNQQAAMREQLEQFTAIAGPVLMVACAAWVGLLALGNVRDRRAEIGILRAIGLRSGQILTVFLSKAVLVGLAGGIVGAAAAAALAGSGEALRGATGALVIIVIAAPMLCVAASWLPALAAARQDPAGVLAED